MATYSSVVAWRIPGTAEPGGLPSMGVTQSRTRLTQLSSSSNKDLLYSAGNSAQSYVATWMGGGLGEIGYMYKYG